MTHWTVAVQRDLNRQEKWAERNLTKFNDNRQEFLHLARIKDAVVPARHSPARQQLCRAENKLHRSQPCALAVVKANRKLGCTNNSLGSSLRDIHSSPVRLHREYCVQF